MSLMLALIGAISATPQPVTFNGSFDTTAAPSGGIVTSSTLTGTVPAGNSGQLTMSGSITGTIIPECSVNGGAFAELSNADSIIDDGRTIGNGQTLQFRIRNASAGERADFDLIDVHSNTVIEQVNIVAS